MYNYNAPFSLSQRKKRKNLEKRPFSGGISDLSSGYKVVTFGWMHKFFDKKFKSHFHCQVWYLMVVKMLFLLYFLFYVLLLRLYFIKSCPTHSKKHPSKMRQNALASGSGFSVPFLDICAYCTSFNRF